MNHLYTPKFKQKYDLYSHVTRNPNMSAMPLYAFCSDGEDFSERFRLTFAQTHELSTIYDLRTDEMRTFSVEECIGTDTLPRTKSERSCDIKTGKWLKTQGLKLNSNGELERRVN